MTIVPVTADRFDELVTLIQALADYEHLPRPDAAAIARLREDAFAPQPKFEAVLAIDTKATKVLEDREDESGGRPVGYAIWFYTYSTFLARPTIYLEDLFVLESARRSGAGSMLFDYVRDLGRARGCGRMEWTVLDWNSLAREFYERRGATWLKEWLLYRVTY